jgi:hypothetical protein
MYNLLSCNELLFYVGDVNYAFCVILVTNCDDFDGPDWATEESEFDFLRGAKIVHFCKVTRPALGLMQYSIR